MIARSFLVLFLLLVAGCATPHERDSPGALEYVAFRIGDGPIISPDTDPSIGHNIQGPSLIRAPSWIKNPLGRYYLYFADHKGSYIRLALSLIHI